MVQPADLGDGDDASIRRRLDRTRNWRVSIQREMAPGFAVIELVGPENRQQMRPAEDDHVIQTLSANGPDHPFGVWILPWGPTGGDDLADPYPPDSGTKGQTVDGGTDLESVS